MKSLKTVLPFVVMLFVLFVTKAATAADKTHDGTVVSVTSSELVMADKDKTEHKHTIGADVKVSLDGKDVKITDLKKGDSITVTQNDAGKVTKVVAKRK